MNLTNQSDFLGVIRMETLGQCQVEYFVSYLKPGHAPEDALGDSFTRATPAGMMGRRNEFWSSFASDALPIYDPNACETWKRHPFVMRDGYYAVVLDGQSEHYVEPEAPRSYGGVSAGAAIQEVVLDTIKAKQQLPIDQIISSVNQAIYDWHTENGVDHQERTERAGTTLAMLQLAEIDGEPIIRLRQVGDAMIAWERRDGTRGCSINQVEAFDRLGVVRLANYFRECGDWSQARSRFVLEHLRQGRHEVMNNPDAGDDMKFSVLNGDDRFWTNAYEDQSLYDLRCLALCSDGALPTMTEEKSHVYCGRLLDQLADGGWCNAIRCIRTHQQQKNKPPVEASGIYFEFDS